MEESSDDENGSSDSTDGSPKEALIKNSFPPGKLFICQETTDFSGIHLHVPVVVLNFGESASLGTGINISTLFAVERFLN